MDFSYVKNLVAKIKKNQLPGRVAHAIMTHKSRREELHKLDFSSLSAKAASVMVLIYPNSKNKACIALIRRNKYPGVHSNQIGLPGGAQEENDLDEAFTALRETEEEIGVSASQIQLVSALTQLYIPPSNFLVSPYLGTYSKPPKFKLQEAEVEEIIEIKVEDLLNDEYVQYKEVSSAYLSPTTVKCLYLNNEIVWGATAMILSELKEYLNGIIKNSNN